MLRAVMLIVRNKTYHLVILPYFLGNTNNVCLEQMVKMTRPVDSAYL